MWSSRAILICLLGLLASRRIGAGTIAAVPLPNPQVPGFVFPESEATVVGWVTAVAGGGPGAAEASSDMTLHGWGLWTALTLETSQVDNAQRLRVFETWFTPQELSSAPLRVSAGGRSALLHFNQFQHGSAVQERRMETGSDTVFGYVKYDPTASAHIRSQQLLQLSTLNQLIAGGAQQIPVFPPTALSLKSAFEVLTSQTLVDGRYYRLNAWTGPPSTPRAWGPGAWPGVVWIDVMGAGGGSGQIDMIASTDGSSRTDETTYPVSSMINHRLSQREASEFNEEQPGADAAPGDYAVLVAMHVAGREIARWTWQTFWWTPTPADPQVPSSAAIAALRPAQLQGAPGNYAMAMAYDMVSPGQPNAGGANMGDAIYAYNPYLEARFGPQSLPDSQMGYDPSGQPAPNNVGVESNCMSCHARANYNPGGVSTAPRYTGARYTDVNDPQFTGTLQVDMLWSLPEIAR
jgi:hypothetical protein